jgi:glycyl-tRNA synthetase
VVPNTFQELLITLQGFWAEHGCVLWQPYNQQVGAGTMNPATFLRVLGPEPWRVAYLEPSVRPADARYGENPNRMGQHYQLQVILKPDPGNPQELYLQSLQAAGIDPTCHDLRFVEDNWEAPALGAWGVGWEVWLDGQEITQFTYFQQAGGLALDSVAVEITYGLERILMALRGARHFAEIPWNAGFSYGDLNLQSEQENSRYFFEVADVKLLQRLFGQYEKEARAALSAGLVLPAYDYLLKCSHTFNLLDSRGAVGVTERAGLFNRMRDLARRTAQAYLEQRQALGYPWMDKAGRPEQAPEIAGSAAEPPWEPADFLLEVGVEELPVAELERALEQLQTGMVELLDETRLAHGPIRVMGTPRRLVVLAEALAPSQAELKVVRRGPPTRAAYDPSGAPTAAALGFARSAGVAVEALSRQRLDGGEYVVAEIQQPGAPSREVLSRALPELLGSLRFEKPMRWDGAGVSFARPVRWLLALHGTAGVPFRFAGLLSGRHTRGLRHARPESWELRDPREYLSTLEQQGIVLDPAARRERTWGQVSRLAAEVGGQVVPDAQLLEEVAHLVEAPTALRGEFDVSYLELPREVLASVMKKHQRYFPVEREGKLLPFFIAVRNGDTQGMEQVVRGNEQVIRARFADAAYFVERDRRQPLEAYLPQLDRLTFHAKLGSMLAKARRVERLTGRMATVLKLGPRDRKAALRAARLCKADLATRMVIDMTSLQGVMGREYALASGEPAGVAQAIYEHYLPRQAGDSLPESRPGVAVGLADRLDTLVALFAVGLQPTGTSDPYGLRRAALGLLQIAISADLPLNLSAILTMAGETLVPAKGKSAARDQQAPVSIRSLQEGLAACREFLLAREQNLLLERGHRHDVVEAVVAAQGDNPAGAARAAGDLERRVQQPDWPETLHAFARCARITRTEPKTYLLRPEALVEPASKALWTALRTAERRRRRPGSVSDFLAAFQPMVPTINRFFDDVLVHAKQASVRRNRLALLQRVVGLAEGVADLSRLEGF